MNKRLAITISGAVALGCYEAGVLFEVLDAIKQHNTHPDTKPEERIEIDVITGASAGGMTSVIAAQKLLLEASSLEDPYQNSLYQPWVVDISIEELLKVQGADRPTTHILSSQAVADISHRYLTARYQHSPVAPPDRHPAAAVTLQLGLALSNLSGVQYSQPLKPGGDLVYTLHKDCLVRALSSTDAASDTQETWENLRAAAVASGAFPWVFSVVDLMRSVKDYKGAELPPSGEVMFTYTDGGVFQNEPLGMARDLANKIDQHRNTDSRFYLYISPFAGRKVQDETEAEKIKNIFNSVNAYYLPTLMHLAVSVFEQARSQDWLQMQEISEQAELFETRAQQLKQALHDGTASPAALRPAADMLLPILFAGKHEEIERGRQRLAHEYAEDCGHLGQSAAAVFVDTLLMLETAALLATKDTMTIYAITAGEAELASSKLEAFSGFFDQSYREHDYNVGRTKAQQFLRQAALGNPGQLGPFRYTPKPIHEMNGATLSDS